MNKMDWASIVEEHRRRMAGEAEENYDVRRMGAAHHHGSSSLAGLHTALGGGHHQNSLSFEPNTAAMSSLSGVNLSSLWQSSSSAATAPVVDFAALQQRILLEEQAKRDFVAQVLMNSQLPSRNSTTTVGNPSVADLLEKLRGLQQQQSPGISRIEGSSLLGPGGRFGDGEPPMKKKARTSTDAKAAAVPLSSHDRHATFPLPALKGKDRLLRLENTADLRKTFQRLESSSSLADPALRLALAQELFRRRLGAKHNVERLERRLKGAGATGGGPRKRKMSAR